MRDLETQLKTIAEYARKLRDAGVTRCEIGSIRLEFAPAESPIVRAAVDEDEELDALNDPATYGLFGANDRIPGFPRVRAVDDES